MTVGIATSKQVREPSRELNADELAVVIAETLPRPTNSNSLS
jgi:hypothetical protein